MHQPEFLEQRFQSSLAGHRVFLVHLQHGQNVVLHAELAKHGRLLGQVPDAALGASVHGLSGQVVHHPILVFQRHAPAIRLYESGHHIKGGGLASAVGAEEPDDFTGPDFEPDFVDHFAAAVLLHDGVGGELHSEAEGEVDRASSLRWMRLACRMPIS